MQSSKLEAQRWIANWQQKQKEGASTPSSNGRPAAPAPPSSSQAEWNKKDAQQVRGDLNMTTCSGA